MSPEPVRYDSESARTYLGLLQSVINRMASNSTACKTWCVTIVAAVIVIIADKGKPDFIWIGLFPVSLFFFLDSYYLAQERCFRNLYNEFVSKLHSGSATMLDLYVMKGLRGACKTICSVSACTLSISIWPFYGFIVVMLVIVRFIIIGHSPRLEVASWLNEYILPFIIRT